MKKKIIIIILSITGALLLSVLLPVRTENKSIIVYEHKSHDGGKSQNIKVYYNIWNNIIYPIGTNDIKS